jgi:hypothetical protein
MSEPSYNYYGDERPPGVAYSAEEFVRRAPEWLQKQRKFGSKSAANSIEVRLTQLRAAESASSRVEGKWKPSPEYMAALSKAHAATTAERDKPAHGPISGNADFALIDETTRGAMAFAAALGKPFDQAQYLHLDRSVRPVSHSSALLARAEIERGRAAFARATGEAVDDAMSAEMRRGLHAFRALFGLKPGEKIKFWRPDEDEPDVMAQTRDPAETERGRRAFAAAFGK